jgi:hypothetical protein
LPWYGLARFFTGLIASCTIRQSSSKLAILQKDIQQSAGDERH